MPSPVPGMDPYIEQPTVWSDFHSRLASGMSAALNAQIRPRYVARLTPYVTYDQIEVGQPAAIRPDVGVWQTHPPKAHAMGPSLVAPPAPVTSRVRMEVPLELFSIEIRAVVDMVLVTAIEVLSPVNKRRGHDAYHDYLRKRRDLLRSAAHLLELDLLRAGERPPLESPVPVAPYYITLSRADHRPGVEVWPIQLWDGLPIIPVPLREPDPDAVIDLPTIVSRTYDEGGYDLLIDYRLPPPPPDLTAPESEWLDRRLREVGART